MVEKVKKSKIYWTYIMQAASVHQCLSGNQMVNLETNIGLERYWELVSVV